MSDLGLNVLIVGGSGGIGWALCKTLSTLPNVTVMATYRQGIPAEAEDYSDIVWLPLDVCEPSQYAPLVEGITEVLSGNKAARQSACLDWVINCVGQLSIDHELPEKNLKSIEADRFTKAMQINTLPTLLLAQHLQSLLRRSAAPRFATVSARVGSISDNGLGGGIATAARKRH
ncbi:SDR family NAD(P)-dependent oxidoreductase [Vibrio variabilis]|uniref:SDR family NAD(P)-dependent oxidoreductase n=1 Tax=Vibrio variabilis TaxID=990271 RepID=UPI0030B7F82F